MLELIASGGTSDIYRARDLAAEPLDERHADLVLKIARASDKEQARFSAAMTRHEALIGRRLRHPNIVAVHDFDRDGALRFVTMEHVPGETLAERLARSPNQRLPKADAIRIAREVAAALECMHQQGIVHSDLKPANILLSESGSAKLIDFSTARVCTSFVNMLPMPPDYAGYSPSYASPELLRDESASPADDIFSFGCIVYEMLSGHHPYQRLPATEALAKNLTPPRRPPLDRRAWRPLRRALSFDRRSRPQRAGDIARALGPDHSPQVLRVVASLTIVLAATGVGWLGTSAVVEHLDRHRTFAATHTEMLRAEALRKQILAAPPLERANLLSQADTLPEPFRGGVIYRVRDAATAPVIRRIENELLMGRRAEEPIRLRETLDILSHYYPDSAELATAARTLDNY